MKKSICIIKFAPIQRDARVLRQIKYLAPHYDLTIIGYGRPHPAWENISGIRWISLAESRRTLFTKLSGVILLTVLGKIRPFFYDTWYWQKSHHVDALKEIEASNCAAIHANDWETLPLAVAAAKKIGAQVIFDAPEYEPLTFENVWYWKLMHSPAISHFLRQYALEAKAAITVAPIIAARYQQEFKFDPIVVLNAPEYTPLPGKAFDPHRIRLIHHGVSNRDRRLELMIETVALCDRRYSLHLMLVENDPAYIRSLKRLADQLAPGRVSFHEPVAPENIVQRIAAYDIGFCLLAPTSYNLKMALPNKFFDFIAAGLAVCIGPSPSMTKIVRQYNLGCIASTFDPRDVAATLNQLKPEQLITMQQASRAAAQQFNAEKEMGKVIQLYHQLLGEKTQVL